MSLTREDMLKELELLPAWQLRNPLPQTVAQAPSPAVKPEHLLQGEHDRGYLPHLKAQGATYFVTFRLNDSLPSEQLEQLASLPIDVRDARVEDWLNAGHGECLLAQAPIAEIVKESLLARQGQEYKLHEWVLMPNHVHLLIEPLAEYALSDILQAIKSTSAHRANASLSRSGAFWQRESYDHLIREERDFEACADYIRQNPVKAGIADSYDHYQYGSAYAGEGACATLQAPISEPVIHNALPSAELSLGQGRRESILQLDWQGLQDCVTHCEACSLSKTRTQTVFGVGDSNADWLIVGEAPGAEEDKQGEPFVGQAGKLLDNMLAAIQLKRGENVYIANVLKCRPPQNRDPQGEEVMQCDPFLKRQVELIKPKLIIALGKFAAQSLLASEATIASMRGTQHSFHGVPVIVTYHPAYLLRNLPDKAKAWEDLCMARELMQTLQSADASPSN